MYHFKELAKKEVPQLENALKKIDAFLVNAPEGCLKWQNKKGKTYYYHQFMRESKWVRRYIKKDELSLAKKLAQKHYYLSIRPILEKMLDESVVCLSRKQVSDYLRISVNTADLETDAGVVYNNDDIKQYIEDKYGFKVHSAYIGQVREKLGIHQHENYNDSHTSPRKPTVCPAEKEAAIIDALKHFKLI